MSIEPKGAFSALPDGLRDALLHEYSEISVNFAEHRWSPSEMSGGRFCEVVYTIIKGHADGSYPALPEKPNNMLQACRQLENQSHIPRSFRILIPRILPALYEVRNNRGVGHVGGDINPNHMDSTLIMSTCNWIMAELVRVLHDMPTEDAQELADALVEWRLPLVWHGPNMKRVLNPKMSLREQILILGATSSGTVEVADLMNYCDANNKTYFIKLLREMHSKRLLELSKDEAKIQILPPGSELVSDIVEKYGAIAT